MKSEFTFKDTGRIVTQRRNENRGSRQNDDIKVKIVHRIQMEESDKDR